VTTLAKALDSIKVVISNVLSSNAQCGGKHEICRQSDVKHQIYVLEKVEKSVRFDTNTGGWLFIVATSMN